MNFCVWAKRPARDINAFEQLGNSGLNWESYQKYTLRAEQFTPADRNQLAEFDWGIYTSRYCGDSGPVKTTSSWTHHLADKLYLSSLENMGVKTVEDPYGGDLVKADRTEFLGGVSVYWGVPEQLVDSEDKIEAQNAPFRQGPSKLSSLYAGNRFVVFAIIKHENFEMPAEMIICAHHNSGEQLRFTVAVEEHRTIGAAAAFDPHSGCSPYHHGSEGRQPS
ncbi:hypothetical protein PHLCEN_2v5433 [Hermanssonia centrifuga]|uniref:Uncharacterized protein n=1 Tax=Hermanssonia centrifuga TaxID=98765 RepID=A0A2R6P2H5_9APHY|nr:hypothetical protein PHLCEN_2v5433 [Hermanssonia centrifuga]